jgi:hypothetical protein
MVILLSKIVIIMQGVVTPFDHILDADPNLETEVKQTKCFITFILSKL